ncbi:MAG: phosphoesterase, partial [Acidobacteria bacterium]|nr:phosphoesterase [Acidobacteriota bacterium]
DASFKSCAKFIATVTRERFGFHCPDLDELVEWADVIDGAQFPDARTAVELKEPALQLMLVIEGTRDHGLLHQIIRQLQSVSLHQVATSQAVQEVFRDLYQKHQESIEIIRSAARFQDGIIYFDLSDTGPEGYNKFIPYYLYPTAQYSVGISRSGWRSKIAVGSNPWALQPRRHNLAEICERYGGGGHPVVAAISLGPDEVDKARSVASRIVQELRSSG